MSCVFLFYFNGNEINDDHDDDSGGHVVSLHRPSTKNRVSDVIESMVTILSPFCEYNTT